MSMSGCVSVTLNAGGRNAGYQTLSFLAGCDANLILSGKFACW